MSDLPISNSWSDAAINEFLDRLLEVASPEEVVSSIHGVRQEEEEFATEKTPFQERYWTDPVGFCKNCIAWRRGEGLTAYQEEILGRIPVEKRVCFRGPRGTGKAHPVDLIIDTPQGRRRFGDLRVGGLVFGANGQPVRVTGVFPRGRLPVYKVVFNDGSETLCSADHLWTVRRYDWRDRWETYPLSKLIDQGITYTRKGEWRCRKWAIPTAEPLEYTYQWVPVDPYTLGAWLGDGTRLTPQISGKDAEVGDRIRAAGYKVTLSRRGNRPNACPAFTVAGLVCGLRHAGVFECGSHEKFVPLPYLENTTEARREVLRGLLDTDGTVTKEGAVTFDSVSHQLAKDVAWLARSLGGVARLHTRKNAYGPFYHVAMTLPEGRWFYIERKQEQVKPTSQKRYLSRWIDRVELLEDQEVRCISVEAPDGLYVANDAIVTHNTTLMSLALLWYATTRDGFDWKIVTTASVNRQLKEFLWPEIHKWARRLRWDRIGRKPFAEKTELLSQELRLRTGSAFTITPSDPAAGEGAHAEHMLYIFDEAKVIADANFDAAEGALSSGEGTEAFALCGSTPGDKTGRFYNIQINHEGRYGDWWTRAVSQKEVIAAGRMTEEFAERRAVQWGPASFLYLNQILGEFASQGKDGVIPYGWAEAAQERWREREDAPLTGEVVLAVDVADEEGSDKTVVAVRIGKRIVEIHDWMHQDTMGTVARVVEIAAIWNPVRITVDGIGLGAGVVSRLRELELPVFNFIASSSAGDLTAAGGIKFGNLRAAAWWSLRERLHPQIGAGLELHLHDHILADLTAPTWRMPGDRIFIESKEDIRKRLQKQREDGGSTDVGDAVVMAFWDGSESTYEEAYSVHTDASLRASQLRAEEELTEAEAEDRYAKWEHEKLFGNPDTLVLAASDGWEGTFGWERM